MIFRKKKKDHSTDYESVEWTEADQALAKSRLEAGRAMAEWPRVEQVSKELGRQLQNNNFAERIRAALGG